MTKLFACDKKLDREPQPSIGSLTLASRDANGAYPSKSAAKMLMFGWVDTPNI
jgi:hypothetical protein